VGAAEQVLVENVRWPAGCRQPRLRTGYDRAAPRRFGSRPAACRRPRSTTSPPAYACDYLTAAGLVKQFYRGLADNSVGRVVDLLLHNGLVIIDEYGFAPLDDTGTQLLSRTPPPMNDVPSGSARGGQSNPGDAFSPNTSPPPACPTGL